MPWQVSRRSALSTAERDWNQASRRFAAGALEDGQLEAIQRLR